MADWGVLTALQGQNNWQQRRYERQRETQLMMAQNQLLEQELGKQMQSAAAIDEYMQTISQVKALEPDVEKVRQKEQQLRQTIQSGVAKYGGNVKKYLLSGGINELNKYRRTLLDSPEVQTALSNSANYNEFLKDRKEGLTGRFTSWKDINTGETKQGTFEQQYQDFAAGNTPTLNYRGGFKMPKFDETIFTKFYGNQNRTYQPVSADDYYRAAFDQFADLNAEDRQSAAMLHTQNYVDRLKNKATPLHWKFDDPLDRQVKLSLIAKNRADAQAASIPEYYTNVLRSNQVTNPIIPADNRNNPLQIKMQDGSNVGLFSYLMPTDFSERIASNFGLLLKDGQVQNKDNLVSMNNFYTIDGRKVDLSGVDVNSILSAVPMNQVIELNDGKNVKRKGLAFTITLSEGAAENARIGGEKIEGFLSSIKNIPGLSKIYGDEGWGFTGIDNPLSSADHKYPLVVVTDNLPASPQARFNVDAGIGLNTKGKLIQQAYVSGYQDMLGNVFNQMSQVAGE